MKRSEIFFSAIQVPVDILMILVAALTAWQVRLVMQDNALLPRFINFTLYDYLAIVWVVAPVFILVFTLEGLYRMRVTRKFWEEAYRVFQATSLVLVIIIIAIFLKREWFSSRFIILAGWLLTVFYVVCARYLIQRAQKWYLVNRGIGIHRVLLIGYNDKMKTLRTRLMRDKELGYRVVDQIDDASITHIKTIRQAKGIDEIIVGDPAITDDEQNKLLDFCQINNITFKFLPTTLQTTHYSMQLMNDEPMIEFQHTPLDGWGKILKRTFDIIAGSLLTILFAPIMLIIALLIKLEDPGGPIIYRNERIGENGKKFLVFKFRYMLWKYCVTDQNPDVKQALAYEKQLIEERNERKGGVLYKIRDDPRKMRVGAVIERLSLDELPQFWNVLCGEMSLVGPRPHQEREVDRYHEYHRRLLTIKPGVTGMAQVSGRSDLAFEDEYHLDVFYIENWSLWLDVFICLKTVGAVLHRRKNASKK